MLSKLSTIFFVGFALTSWEASAQKGGRIVEIAPPTKGNLGTTAPRVIDESEQRKECPAGFTFIGKQCAKTLTVLPEGICAPGTIPLNDRCVKYVGKDSECPLGYNLENGICLRKNTALPDTLCPAGFELIGKDCLQKVALPDITECPAGTVAKGDLCLKSILEAPDFVCPGGYNLVGRRCQRENTFDCTPIRRPTAAPVEEKNLHLRAPAISKGKETNVYHLPVSAPTVEEYVIQETCKRIITEDARPICPAGGDFNGKMCEREVPQPEIRKAGGFRDIILPAAEACPEGFEESRGINNNLECLAIEYAPHNLFCPQGTVDLGDKCAIYSDLKTLCPDGFYLEGKLCTKTVFAAPLVEYTVTYSCTGKNCANNGKH